MILFDFFFLLLLANHKKNVLLTVDVVGVNAFQAVTTDTMQQQHRRIVRNRISSSSSSSSSSVIALISSSTSSRTMEPNNSNNNNKDYYNSDSSSSSSSSSTSNTGGGFQSNQLLLLRTLQTIAMKKSVVRIQQRSRPDRSKLFSSVSSSSPSFSANTALADNTIATTTTNSNKELSKLMSIITRLLMISYITGMCIMLPITLYPLKLLYKFKLINQLKKERWSLSVGRFCSRTLLQLIPFCNLQCIIDPDAKETTWKDSQPQPCIWVCNHISMLDVFLLLAGDRKLRGPYKRPIKIVYWKTLEDNPITKLLFTMCGFIPVEMKANAPGEDNQYDRRSFKLLLQAAKQAFADGFDVALLPEGQLNPAPELGLLPTFTGAYTLAKMSNRPIYMMSLYNTHKLWHPIDGMITSNRNVKIRCYNTGRYYKNADDFKVTFETVVGYFGRYGFDIQNYEDYLNGTIYQQKQDQLKEMETKNVIQAAETFLFNEKEKQLEVDEVTTSPIVQDVYQPPILIIEPEETQEELKIAETKGLQISAKAYLSQTQQQQDEQVDKKENKQTRSESDNNKISNNKDNDNKATIHLDSNENDIKFNYYNQEEQEMIKDVENESIINAAENYLKEQEIKQRIIDETMNIPNVQSPLSSSSSSVVNRIENMTQEELKQEEKKGLQAAAKAYLQQQQPEPKEQ